MLLANIIFAAPSAVYISTFFIPLATILALGTELYIFEPDAARCLDQPTIAGSGRGS